MRGRRRSPSSSRSRVPEVTSSSGSHPPAASPEGLPSWPAPASRASPLLRPAVARGTSGRSARLHRRGRCRPAAGRLKRAANPVRIPRRSASALPHRAQRGSGRPPRSVPSPIPPPPIPLEVRSARTPHWRRLSVIQLPRVFLKIRTRHQTPIDVFEDRQAAVETPYKRLSSSSAGDTPASVDSPRAPCATASKAVADSRKALRLSICTTEHKGAPAPNSSWIE